MSKGFILLVYKLPQQPTRLRIQAWRRLQALGAVYLQDGIAALPLRPDLEENLRYVAESMIQSGGTAISLRASTCSEADDEEIEGRFRAAADVRMSDVLASLEKIRASADEVGTLEGVSKVDDALKRERIAYLKARRLNYFGSDLEKVVESRLAELSDRLARFGGSHK
ncbi:MAG: hypothetical protein JSS48_08595 [Nitrospira sp.]|nr:hypothetical protein [Nitrospira sp.]